MEKNKNENVFYLADGVQEILVSKCVNCGTKYGRKPYVCCGCGSKGQIIDILPCNQ